MTFKLSKRAFFVSIPHSGTKIPPEAYWLQNKNSQVLMCDVDAFVDQLYLPILKKEFIPYIIFKWHRYAVDANRLPMHISSQTVQEAQELLKTVYQNKNFYKSPSDIHWYKSTRGHLLIDQALSQKTHKLLIKKYFTPFHKKITQQFDQFKQQGHSKVYMMDLHSMPAKGLAFHADKGQQRADIVIGTNYGKSCSESFKNLVLNAYKKVGFKTALNSPYKGGAITRTYGQPKKGQELLQVEINRKLYMNERTKEKNTNYKQLQIQLERVILSIAKGISSL